MKMKVVLDAGCILPTRAHADDAGLDLYSPYTEIVYPNDSVTIDTGVHVAIPKGYVGMIKSKSGLNVKQNLLSEGVIDSGYVGSIVVKLYNHGKKTVKIEKGQKISQLVLLPIITPELELVDSLEETERGDGGFGSTGAFCETGLLDAFGTPITVGDIVEVIEDGKKAVVDWDAQTARFILHFAECITTFDDVIPSRLKVIDNIYGEL